MKQCEICGEIYEVQNRIVGNVKYKTAEIRFTAFCPLKKNDK